MKVLVSAFKQEKVQVGASSVIGLADGSFAALVHTGGGAPEAELPRLRGHDPGEAAEADRVGAGQQLGPVLRPVIAAWAVPPVDMMAA